VRADTALTAPGFEHHKDVLGGEVLAQRLGGVA
jgi:hypothetical protein